MTPFHILYKFTPAIDTGHR